ncbi:surface-adhesin E family protein [Pseudomonas sp. Fl4BN1]|uniref:surface-adhesin E family protein n=1 Tax=Pseudomonas sp. Fl4BN1 TaxID=2697651 RepID=UPI001378BFDE|nr:surface-adhesin E family protein [Pseudomonas sp. Fl4BN1]NBF09001.1 hypothetical protein [Pseudomonas sp. Fl4BN1]
MNKLLSLSVAVVLAGCAHSGAPKEAPAAQRPDGMFKVLETPELGTYFAANSLALYQNNPNLRQFYLVNNYAKPTQLSDGKPPIYSSRATRVINCEKDESAQFGRVYFSEPYAQGVEVTRKDDLAQWTAFPRQSLLGELRNMACGVDPTRLKLAPATP